MNAKLLCKMVFLILLLLVLVMIGVNNREAISFTLSPNLPRVRQPAAIMYYLFFAIGLLTGTILTAGAGGKSGGSTPKSGKSGR